jgi:AbrB family looped-hinge helix DNA binding protein
MFAQTLTIDRYGRITLPQQILESLGLQPETEVIIELAGAGIVIKPRRPSTPITARITAMNLPIADWNQMEQEIEMGRLV